MSGTVDDRVVGIKFDNSSFERGAAVTLSTLQKLKESFNISNATSVASKSLGVISSAFSKFGITNPFARSQQGVAELSAETSRFSLAPLTNGVAGVSKSFIAMSTVAITALSNIVNRAVNAGLSFAKSFTVGPIIDGLHEYETNLKSVQTIQANTDRPLKEVEASLAELNRYSDQTIYNFSEMARNIGTFTAAGVDLKTATSSIKGIANLAALSGSSSQQAATAMYQLSQAISSGRVGLQDWNSVVNAGMGGKKLQNALAQTAIAMGDIDASAVKMVGPMKKLEINGGSFRESIMAKPGETPWLSSDILVNTLATMDGRFSKAALAAEKTETGLRKYTDAQIKASIADSRAALEKKNGVKYTDEQFKALQQMSTSAFEAATKVKTLGQVFDVAKETIASGWSASFKNIFGNLDQAKKLFTGMSEGINGIINANALARNTLLAGWAEDGGRTKVIQGFKNAWAALLAIAKPITKAFRAIFPAKTSDDLVAMSQAFKDFTEKLIIGGDTAKNIKQIFKGIFSIFSIAGQIIGGAASAIFDLIGIVGKGGGGFLDFSAGIGQFLSKLDKALKKGDTFKEFFATIADVIAVPLSAILGLGDALGNLFGGANSADADSFANAIGSVTEKLSPLEAFAVKVREAISRIGGVFGSMGKKIGEAMGGIGPAISGAFSSGSFDKALSVLNTALLGGIVYLVKNFFDGLGGGAADALTGGFFTNVKDALSSVTDTMSIMQTNVKANIILKIAGALAIMAAAIALLAMLDPRKVTFAMGALAAGFYGMQTAMIALVAALGVMGAAKLPLIATGLVLVATSLLIFAAAVALMGAIPFDNIVRGLFGIGGMLFILQKFLKALDNKGMVRSAAAMVLLGVAMNLMATALKIFATMSWEEMAKGLTALSGTLIALAGAMRVMPKDMVLQAVALLVLSAALNAMAVALKIFATMSWEEMAKGLVGLAGSLVIIAGAMRLMPKDMVLQAVALNAVASALVVLSAALIVMGGMTWEEIAKGLVTLAGSMLILAGGLYLMSGTLSGSAALLVAVAALTLFVPVLVALGAMSWESIIKGLVGLAGVFIILGVAGTVLGPASLAILGLGAALFLLGAGLALAGTGALAFATAFGIIVGLGLAGVSILASAIGTFIAAIPAFMKAFAIGLGQFAEEITKKGPAFTSAMSTILGSILDSVIKNAPKMAKAFLAMLNAALKVITTAAPRIVNAGLNMIVSFLEAISSKIGRITKLAIDIVVKFLDSIASRMDKIIQSGVNLILSFLEGISKALNDPANQQRLVDAAKGIGGAIIDGMIAGVKGGIELIKDAAKSVAKAALQAAKDVLGIKSPSREFKKIGVFVNEGFVQGLKGSEADVIAVVTELGDNIKTAAESAASEIESLTGNLKDLKKAKKEALKDKNKKNDDKYDKDIKKGKIALDAAKAEQELIKKTQAIMKGPEYKAKVAELKLLGQEYDRNAEKIKELETQLTSLTQYRDGIQNKFDTSPDIAKNTSLESYNRNAEKEKAKVQEFNADLQALLGLGLDKESYNKLLEEGLDAQPFIDKLIAAGPSAVEAFDQSNAGLTTAAKDLGNNSTVAMYGVGVDTVQGLLDGVNGRQTEITSMMAQIGAEMVASIKKSLKIKSPSRAFMEVGKYSNEGLAQGLTAYSGAVNAAAAGVGDGALETMRLSLQNIGGTLPADMNMNPVIAPVLDLSQLQKDATKIGGFLPESSIVGQVSYGAAAEIADNVQNGGTFGGEGPAGGGDVLNYSQTIYTNDSPSEIAIFRGTRNQLSMKKEELKSK